MTSFDEKLDIEQCAAWDCGHGNKGWVIGMAYVPDQCWCDLYDESVALQRGTLFPDLDKPFTGRKQVRHG